METDKRLLRFVDEQGDDPGMIIALSGNPGVIILLAIWSKMGVKFRPGRKKLPKDDDLAWERAWQHSQYSLEKIGKATGLGIGPILQRNFDMLKAIRAILPDGTIAPAAAEWLDIKADHLMNRRNNR